MISPTSLIRSYYAAYENKDRAAIEALIADDFTFTSPIDDNIGLDRYFERCWPNSEHIDAIKIEKLFIQGDEAFVQYELHSKDKPPFHNAEHLTLRDGRVTHVDVYFGAETGDSARQHEIRLLLETRADALRRKDVDALAAVYAPDAVRYSLAPPLQSNEPIKDEFRDWFATWVGGIGCEMRNLQIEVSGELACCHALCHMTGTKKDGTYADVWFRETLCLSPIDGQWRIVHDHESVPFYMDGSFKAAVDLKPE